MFLSTGATGRPQCAPAGLLPVDLRECMSHKSVGMAVPRAVLTVPARRCRADVGVMSIGAAADELRRNRGNQR
ncbi:hypothetical protein GCM10010326_37870 [Streptomyces xanthochromogenes]|uniref:Uncharacterized protein n=1 Tax=Streptomyces xanthochromogenes TaxID=67384 RepID=A0ABQ3A970_9ACTN|nr:hypothetical protein GCM10010326_37870 [Streptomyces xanthochromogenes]